LPALGVAAWLVVANDVRAWAAAGLLSVAVLVGYVFTRLVGTTFDNQDVGNWACVLGLAAIFVEIWLLALSGSALALAKVKLSKPAIEIRSSRPRVTENQRRAANANRP
jgi:predicted Co/Zn/Cd cation transporter (cation efflux family)